MKCNLLIMILDEYSYNSLLLCSCITAEHQVINPIERRVKDLRIRRRIVPKKKKIKQRGKSTINVPGEKVSGIIYRSFTLINRGVQASGS